MPDGLRQLLATKEMVLVCGSGGVGKTSIAAALGIAAVAGDAERVLVLTVDPARRLATALGLDGIGNTAVAVSRAQLADVGVDARGELWVAMLDTKAGWDELVARHAPDPTVKAKILANPLYRNITSRFVHSHDYIAMERLHDLHASGDYDLVIVDTPPSRNALDLLDAPARMGEFFGSRLLRWLTVPYRSRLFTLASKPFYQVADRILGSRFLQDIAEFFMLFQAMEKGFVARAAQVERLLADQRTAFVVATTLEASPSHEAEFLLRELRRRRLPLGAVVFNRTLPAAIRRRPVEQSARQLADLAADSRRLRPLAKLTGTTPSQLAEVLGVVSERFAEVSIVATREAQRRRVLADGVQLAVDLPTLPDDVHDLGALAALGRALIGETL